MTRRIWAGPLWLVAAAGIYALPGIANAGAAATTAPDEPSPAHTAPPLTGNWAGDRLLIRAGESGITVQGDCTRGKIDGPIIPGPDGNFHASGYFNAINTASRSLAGIAPRDSPTRFDGRISGGRMTLTLVTDGKPPKRYTLVRNARIAFARCE